MEDQYPGLEELLPAFHRMSHVYLRQQFDKWGLKELHNPRILLILRDKFHDQAVSQKKIAELMGVASSTAAISIRRMEKAGLIQRTADESDLRVNQVVLTEKGKEFTEEAERAMRSMYGHMMQGFSQEELNMLRCYYMKIIRNMENFGVRIPTDFKSR